MSEDHRKKREDWRRRGEKERKKGVSTLVRPETHTMRDVHPPE